MVKTQFGRKPGKKHAKIVKQLRHRRRQLQAAAASVAGRRMQLSEVVETCSYECLERQPELPFCQFCLDLPEPWWTGSTCSAASDVKVNVDGSEMQLVAFEPEQLQDYESVPVKDVKALTRGASDITVSGCGIAASSKFSILRQVVLIFFHFSRSSNRLRIEASSTVCNSIASSTTSFHS